MKKILLLGAGLSSTNLIEYLLNNSEQYKWEIIIGDISIDLARAKVNNHPRAKAIFFNVDDNELLVREIKAVDIVISMLPARFHFLVARECVRYGVNMVTASYVSKEIAQLDAAAKEKNVLLLNEIGVDPGIDHMSAMHVINRLREEGDQIIAFESSTGGLVAPTFDNNPWRYKFTWNPRNVVLAGQGGARFLHNGKFKYIPYHKLFQRYEIIDIPELGQFEVYPNRDSLKYRETYQLHDLLTMFRGTIRRPGYCDAWNVLVQLGATDDSYIMEDTENMSYRDFTNSFLAYNMVDPVEQKVANYLGLDQNSAMMERLKWLGLFDETKIGIPDLSPAQVLQHILEKKWKLDKGDKDMIIMQHQFDYIRLGTHRKMYSTLVIIGDDPLHTAMSKAVGLPVAMATKLILENKIKLTGVQIPVMQEIFNPILEELKDYGIKFEEKDVKIS